MSERGDRQPEYEWPRAIRRTLAAFRGHPYRQDALLAVGVMALSLTPKAGTRFDLANVPLLEFITSGILSVALIWRRRAPLTVYCVVILACTVQWAAAENTAASLGFMIGLYTIARYCSVRTLRLATAAIVPSLLIFVFRLGAAQHQEIQSAIFAATAVAASIALGLVVEERHAQLEALSERAAHAEFEREQRARMAVLAERARFSREMHDIVGHTLAVITGLADGGVRQVEANPERGRQVFELIGDTSRQALSELRRTLGALRERPLDEGGNGAAPEALTPQPGGAELSELLDRTRSAGPRVTYHADGELSELPRSLQLAIYRIVQESLTNSLKHAGPDTNVRVEIAVGEKFLQVSVSDSGPGAHRAAPPTPTVPGQGLTGVRERAALAGGSAEAGPNSLGGWTVTAEFPLDAAEEH